MSAAHEAPALAQRVCNSMDDRDLYRQKHHLRAEVHLRRMHLSDGRQRSRAIFDRLVALPQYPAAETVLCYVSFRSEVFTHEFLAQMRDETKRVVVPYCREKHLELFRIAGFDDLSPGTLGILEPKAELRAAADRKVSAEEIDLFVIPGLAFDRGGGRLGYGKGYFDHLLIDARPDALLAAVAFECQFVESVPMMPHDVRVDMVITEADLYRRSLPRRAAR